MRTVHHSKIEAATNLTPREDTAPFGLPNGRFLLDRSLEIHRQNDANDDQRELASRTRHRRHIASALSVHNTKPLMNCITNAIQITGNSRLIVA